VKGVLFDLDGVLYDVGAAVPGAAEAVAWVRAQGIPHLFVTNTTSRPRAALVERLAGFGIEAAVSDLLTPPAAAAAWLRDRPGPVALFVPDACRGEFDGLELVPDDAESGASYVVVGDLAERWDFATLNRAFRLLHADPGAKLLALGMTRFWNSPDGIALDVAPFVAALEHASGRKAVVLGKPARAFFAAAVGRLGLDPSEVLMIGDDVKTDVGGAQAAGLRGALVRTGKFRESDLRGEIAPDAVFDSVADLPARWSSVESV
jgi:HAD superfamily hydrolase (TIGR01458 family)